jgi:hypothetical protein
MLPQRCGIDGPKLPEQICGGRSTLSVVQKSQDLCTAGSPRFLLLPPNRPSPRGRIAAVQSFRPLSSGACALRNATSISTTAFTRAVARADSW